MDLCLVILLAGILYWRGIKTVGIQIITFRILFMAMCSLIILFAIEVHRNDTMIKEEAANISRFTQAERKGFYQDSGKRFDTLYSPYQTGNALLAYGAGRTTMYTSTANPVYSSFFYDGIKNPIGNNNRVGLFGRGNPFFLYLMGVQYLESPAGVLPAGYEVQQRKGNAVLAEREDVLPLCYGSTELLRLSEYEKLGFPYNIEALTSRSIVKSGKSGFQGFHSHFKELHPKEGVDYEIQPQTKGGAAAWKDFTVIPAEPLEHKILAVDFRVKAKSRSAVVITINGITNKLSGASAPYPNHNEDFTYFLSSPEPIREFSVKTSGTFEIEDLHIYSLDEEKLGKRQVYPLKKDTESPGKAVGAHSGAGREKISGIITLPEDGYFITSFPWQPGYRVWADGKQVPAENVNTAFVGIPLLAGRHKLLITYEPPLERSGMLLSATGWLLWIGIGLWEAGNRRMHKWMVHSAQQTVISQRLRELFAYGIGGVLTTLVNYVIYFGLERLAVHYLLANTLAWAGAVVFSYWVNRKVVFGSGGSWKREFLDFTGLRLLTLGAENLLLYLAVEQLGLRTAVSKILVSVVTVLANYVICKKHIFKK